MEEDGRQPGKADKELTGLVVGGVAGFAARPEAALSIGVDNLNAVCWIAIGNTRGQFARKFLSASLFCRVENNIDAAVFYPRTNRNVAA